MAVVKTSISIAPSTWRIYSFQVREVIRTAGELLERNPDARVEGFTVTTPTTQAPTLRFRLREEF